MKKSISLKLFAICMVVFFSNTLFAGEPNKSPKAVTEYWPTDIESPGENAAVEDRCMVIFGNIDHPDEREWIAAQSHCNSIEIDSDEVDDSVFSLFEKYNDLREITIQNVEAVRDPNVGKISGVKFSSLTDKKKLSKVILVNCALTDVGLKSLAMLPADKVLLSGRMPYLTPKGIVHLGSMKNLKTLELYCRIANDKEVFFDESMSSLKQVEKLYYRGDGRGYQEFFKGIGGMKSLKSINLHIDKNVNIRDEDFQFLSKLEKLEKFDLHGILKNVKGNLITYMKDRPKIKVNIFSAGFLYYHGTAGEYDPSKDYTVKDIPDPVVTDESETNEEESKLEQK